MKMNSKYYMAIVALAGFYFAVSIPDAQSQVIKKPRPKSELGYQVQRIKPDIVLSDFSINWNAGQLQSMYYTAPFTVRVRNAGRLQTAVPFYVALQYATPVDGAFHGENTGDNCFQVSALLAPNQVYLLQGVLKILSSHIAGQTTRFRAIADNDCLNEFPNPTGKIDEAAENNNYSNEVSYTSGYLPNLYKVSPEICIKETTQCVLSGSSLGPHDNKYTLVIEKDGIKTTITSLSGATSYIKFNVPANVSTGRNRIYIAEINTGNKVSNTVEFTVAEASRVPWTDILSPLALVRPMFSLRLHNWNGTTEPENHSELTYPSYTVDPNGNKILGTGKRVIEVPKIELNNWAGHYRFMLNDMMSAPFGFIFSRTNCSANQFRLNIGFESEGKEIIGYYKVKGPAGKWRREGAPDIHIDNGDMNNLFTLYYYNGTLNYNATAVFSAEVKAANNIEDAFMDFFKASWNDDIRAQLAMQMQMALNSSEVKSMIAGMLMETIQNKIPGGRTIVKIDFTQDAVIVTNY